MELTAVTLTLLCSEATSKRFGKYQMNMLSNADQAYLQTISLEILEVLLELQCIISDVCEMVVKLLSAFFFLKF